MSYIFEALQRAEAERSGGSLPKSADSVADLLQGVEQEIERKQSLSELPPTSIPVPPQTDSFASAKVLLPVLRPDSRLVCLADQGGLAAEKFRVLGLKLRHLRERRKLKRIVITSSIPEEGKSLISANLALNQSRSKILNTVLIDGDLRRPSLGSRFGFNRNLPGLSEVLRGERQLSDVVCKIEGSGLRFISAGVTPENPTELMQSGRLQQLLEQLEALFDWIIIDTPPVLPLADTPLWMKLADGVLLVIREGVSEKKQLERTVEVIDRSTMLGVVVNSCDSNEQKYYYARYGPVADGEESSPPAPER
ncbi:MAG: CpsD/CapB family tyrosine-protein kinase [Terriglobales bacterium]